MNLVDYTFAVILHTDADRMTDRQTDLMIDRITYALADVINNQ